MRSSRRIPLCVALLAGGGCVSTGAYNKTVADLHDAQRATATRAQAAEVQSARLQDDLRKQTDELRAAQQRATQARYERDVLLDVNASHVATLGECARRLEKAGQNLETLSTEKGVLVSNLLDVKTELGDVRHQKQAAESRAASYRGLLDRLQALIGSGEVEAVIRKGRMLLVLPSDVLFDSGQTSIKGEAKGTLTKVARALAQVPGRTFLVVGHTDNVPIHTARFPSNWELSTARAVEVTEFLISQGVKPEAVSAAGRAEFDPADSSESAAGRTRNRRIEIALEPNLTELPSLFGRAGLPASDGQ